MSEMEVPYHNPVFWRNACLKAWQVSGMVENYKILQSTDVGSWRKMWLLRPSIRTDGLYVSRNTCIRAGVAKWKVTNPVHLVCYFRYLQFFPFGRFLYKNSSQKIKDVAKFLNFHASKADRVFKGHYTLPDDKVEAAVLLRGTTAGANNRMDFLSLVISDVNDTEVVGPEEGILGVVEGWEDDETHNPDVPACLTQEGDETFCLCSICRVAKLAAADKPYTNSWWLVGKRKAIFFLLILFLLLTLHFGVLILLVDCGSGQMSPSLPCKMLSRA
ncbi:hypothetical protein SAY87_026375 [Trapa incisa]|uniref:F-box protein n=1 Tax=Trapa incisa TaxID=236973 RepID=A0AAN7JL09_9MYRT|nr:hypothetical protein SAY87_026375 [Trapa incisa]